MPRGYYNIEHMVRSVTRGGGTVGVCGTCLDTRGITDEELADGCYRSTMDELTDCTLQSDQVLVSSNTAAAPPTINNGGDRK